ncbi:MAG: AtpZ/AtpI family protein [Candidatus Pacebacteria bacterium]|nr:AtpZ/AtpI family protein [Candidatus Paceibacterota bacterium]MCF7863127.1 AtpZ/AtpI family protein [Candidatus Paceibacterota bacterium]
MKEEKNNTKNGWWQPAVKIFTEISSWIVTPLIVGLFLGKYLDTKYDTKPWFFLGMVGLSFAISCFGIVKATLKHIKKMEKTDAPKRKFICSIPDEVKEADEREEREERNRQIKN